MIWKNRLPEPGTPFLCVKGYKLFDKIYYTKDKVYYLKTVKHPNRVVFIDDENYKHKMSYSDSFFKEHFSEIKIKNLLVIRKKELANG